MIFNLICFSRNKKALNVGKLIRIKMDDDEIGIYDEFMKELIIKMTMRIIIMMTAMMMRRL